MDNIGELNELIYAGAKLVIDKIELSHRILDGNTKPAWEMRIERQIKNLWLEKLLRTIKLTETRRNEEIPKRCVSDNSTVRRKSKDTGEKKETLTFRDRVMQYKQNKIYEILTENSGKSLVEIA